jgi:hypothetical protein
VIHVRPAAASSATPKPTGTLTFTVDGHDQPTVKLATDDTAPWSTTSLQAGKHTIVVHYSGDTWFAPSTSAPVAVTVAAAATTGSSGQHGSQGTGQTSGKKSSLASTGSPVGQLMIWSAVLLIGGTVLTVVSVRRRATRHRA